MTLDVAPDHGRAPLAGDHPPARPPGMDPLHLPSFTSPLSATDPPAVGGQGRRRRRRSAFRYPSPPPSPHAPHHKPQRSAMITQSPLSSHQVIDDLHVYAWSVTDVSQEPSPTAGLDVGNRIPSVSPSVSKHLAAVDVTSSVLGSGSRSTSVPESGSKPRVSEPSANKLSTLDTRSAGIDLGAGEERHWRLAALTTVQEKLISLNHGNGVADNTQEEPATTAVHASAATRRVRSAPDPQPTAPLSSPTISPLAGSVQELAYNPAAPSSAYNSSFTTPTSENTPSGAKENQAADVGAQSTSRNGTQVGSGASSVVLMNNPETLGTAAAHGQDRRPTAVTGAPHYVITATAAATTGKGVPEYHTTTSSQLTDDENVILDERGNSMSASLVGPVLPDHMTAPSSGVLEDISPQEDASLYDTEYQVTPATLATPHALPPFLGDMPGLAQHEVTHTQPNDNLEKLGTATRVGDPYPMAPDVETATTWVTTSQTTYQVPFLQSVQTFSESGQIIPTAIAENSQFIINQVSVHLPGEHVVKGVIGLAPPIDIPPQSTLDSPVEASIMTDASTTLLDPAVTTGHSTHSASLLRPKAKSTAIDTGEPTEINGDVNSALNSLLAVTTMGEETTQTQDVRALVTATGKPLSDGPIKPRRLEANNTNLAASREGSRANHNEDNIMPNPQVAPTISHKVDSELGEALASGPRGQLGDQPLLGEEEERAGGGQENPQKKNENPREGFQSEHSDQPRNYKRLEKVHDEQSDHFNLPENSFELPQIINILENQEQRDEPRGLHQDLEGRTSDRNLKLSSAYKENVHQEGNDFQRRGGDNDDPEEAPVKILTSSLFHQEGHYQRAEFSALRTVQRDAADFDGKLERAQVSSGVSREGGGGRLNTQPKQHNILLMDQNYEQRDNEEQQEHSTLQDNNEQREKVQQQEHSSLQQQDNKEQEHSSLQQQDNEKQEHSSLQQQDNEKQEHRALQQQDNEEQEHRALQQQDNEEHEHRALQQQDNEEQQEHSSLQQQDNEEQQEHGVLQQQNNEEQQEHGVLQQQNNEEQQEHGVLQQQDSEEPQEHSAVKQQDNEEQQEHSVLQQQMKHEHSEYQQNSATTEPNVEREHGQKSHHVIDHRDNRAPIHGTEDKPDLESPAHTRAIATPHAHTPSHAHNTMPVFTPTHSPPQEERRRESTQETHEGLPREEGQIPMISTSREEYNVRDEAAKRGYTTHSAETSAGVNIADKDVEDGFSAGEDAVNSSAGEDAVDSSAGEDAAGSSAGEDAAGSSAGEDAAGSSAREDAVGSSAGEDAAGSSAREDSVDRSVGEHFVHGSGGEYESSGSVAKDSVRKKATLDDLSADKVVESGSNLVVLPGLQREDVAGRSSADETSSRQTEDGEDITDGQEDSSPFSSPKHSEVNVDHRISPSQPLVGHNQQSPGNVAGSEASPEISMVMAADDRKGPVDQVIPSGAVSASSLVYEGEEDGWRSNSGGSSNKESEGTVEVTPFSDIDTPFDARESNINSYPGASGSLALPIIGDISLQKIPLSVRDQQTSVGITGIDGIGINDLEDKDQRSKTRNGISLSKSNQTGEIAAKGPSAPATHTGHSVILPEEYKRQKSIESLEKQSAPGFLEASTRPGYSERKESSIDTEGSEANQGHSFLSRSNQMVGDPNQESVHAHVSSLDPVEENRDQIPSPSILSNSDVGGNMMSSDEYEYDKDYPYYFSGIFDYEPLDEETDYEERNNNHDGEVGKEDNSRHEGIEEDERDLKRIPGGSLDRTREGSLLDEESDSGPSEGTHTIRRPTLPMTTHVSSSGSISSEGSGDPEATSEATHVDLAARRTLDAQGAYHSNISTDSNSDSISTGSSDSVYDNSSSDSTNGNTSTIPHDGSPSGRPGGSHHSVMPHREPWQSQDSPCKCPCQCDGGENPPIMPGRVEANLNSGSGAGGPGHQESPASPPASPPAHEHRHRHHHNGTRSSTHTHHATTQSLTSYTLETDSDKDLTNIQSAVDAHTPTPPLTHHSTIVDMVLEAPRLDGNVYVDGAEAYLAVDGANTAEDVVVIRKHSYTLVNAPAVTHVVAAPDVVFAGSTRPTLAPTTATSTTHLPTIHATLMLDTPGGMTVRRPQQVAPPDGASFSALALGEEKAFTLTPYGYWNIHLTLNDLTDLKITLTIPRGTSLGLYARRSALPTHTQHDIMKILRGTRQRDVRASPSMVEVSVEEVLEAGEWFLSIYNDDGEPHQVALVISRGPGEGECPQRCEERGHCILGRCQCEPGYSGIDCSQVLCPILCSGHGDYMNGQCRCHPGFKGKECQLRHHECEVPDCNGQGQCVDGQCHCAKGYTGEFCQTVDCPHPTCSGNGWCVLGSCVCQKGWRGPDCSETDLDARQCLPDCNNHGAFDIELHTCVCHPPWTGSDCSKKSCSLDCGLHGVCENDACTCDEGWKGDNCSEKLCDARCSEHGQCKNGTCVCMTGWNGRHCTLSGCPGNCRNRGTCEATAEGTWYCRCETGWDGPDCSAMLETQCNDGMDNDRDGLMDCQDPECCTHQACKDSQLCVSRASSPIDILLRKQPPAATASFFEKMKFLIEEDSLQHFTNSEAFNMSVFWNHFHPRRAAVVRGRVVTRAGRGVVGLRVSTIENQEGFTLTRRDGWFDIMVNGGGAVTLTFGKPPFSPKTIRVMVPWNEVVVLDDIMMTVTGLSGSDQTTDYHDHPKRQLTSHCPLHDYDLLRPVVMATWQNVFQGECPDVDAILVESQAVQESVQIPGTGMYLVYHSSRANGYESTIRMQLTPDHIPATLRRIHLRIVLEGTLFTRVFEADPNIKFTYAWDRLNVYRQRVHGVTVARVSVGYEHASCPKIIWEHQTARVAGNDLLISKVGGFNLHVHHAYNYHQGILQKGNGQNIYLAGQRRLVTTLLGTGEQREVNCGERCEGKANLSPLLAPTCLAAAPDGSLYVGDFNLIRRVKPDGTVITVARLNETRVSYRYHVAVSPLDGSVYVSDPEAHQVLKLAATENVPDPHHNTIAVVGSGQRCLPGDRNKCGDGGYAIHARLTYPKGLAISSNGDVYIADGTNIRVVNPTGFIYTLIGGHDHRSHWAPVPCNGTINMDQLHLRWPTELAISQLDGSLHILDDHLILRVTPDNRVQVLSGRSLNCPTPIHDPPDVSRTALLLNPQSIAFSPQGELYVAESDTQRINRVRIITSDGRIYTFAGADSRCNCRDPTCYCHTYDNVSASSAIFSSISSIAVTPDNVLHISDQAGYRVRSVRTVLPELNVRKQYEIFSPDAHEVYVFNKYGQHVETRNLVTGQTIYKFSYSINYSAARLLTVTDGASNRFQLIRNYFGDVTSIENPQKQRVKINLSMMKMLEQLVAPDGYNITFRYHGASGLMRSKIEAVGRSYNYDYDEQGRLTQAVLPTGQVIQLTFDLSTRGAEVVVTRDGKNPVRTRVRGNTLTHNSGPVEAVADMGGEGQLRLVTDWGHEVSLERTSYRVLESTSQIAAEMFPILSRQQTHISGELVNRYEWIYSPASQHSGGLGMKVAGTLRVNGADLLTLSYDPVSSSEALFSVSGQMLINITYDTVGRPVRWRPVSPLVPSNVSYDHWGHITGWTRGNLSEEYHYDTSLRLTSVTYADGATVNYDYRETLTKPEKVTHPSGRAYGLVYDDAGSLRQVVTPRGSAYTLHLSTSLGFYRLRLALPVDSIALQIRLDERGRLLAMTQPGHGGTLIYQYNDLGQVSAELYGHGFTEYTYYTNGLIRTAKTKHKHVDIRTEYRYHAGLMKDMRLRYGSKSDLHAVKLRYQYDGSARLRKLEGDINSDIPLNEVYIRFDNQTGVLQLISDLRIIRNNILETMLQNPKKHYVNTRKQDNYGRLSQIDMNLQGKTVFIMQLKYDNRNRISERLIEVGGRREGLNITYMADGQILEATGTHTWLYSYDENGNIISNTDKGYPENLIYDECDRVTSVSGSQVEYDERGFVIRIDNQNFDYNTKGQLISAWNSDENWSFTLGYDHLGRVSIYRDHNNNATQLIYGRPDLPELITHLHNPHTGSTTGLLYDDMNHLIAIDQPDGRYFVATDQNGTPIAIFDDVGSLISSQVWSPFGHLVDKAGSNMWVGVGPWGKFREPQTGLVIFMGYAYHPKLLQWMSPRWGHLTQPRRHVTDVFVYRFMNNNPFNPSSDRLRHYYTDVSDWLELYGIELSRVLGSEYHDITLVAPRPVVAVDGMGASEVVSGLWCQYRAGVRHLHDLSFFSQSHIQYTMGTWNGAPISRQASIFGPGVLVSDIEGRVLVTGVTEDDFSGVIGDVIRTVLNNSIILDVSATHSGLDTFYFIKNSRNRATEDISHFRRLSGIFNVTNSETDHGHEIRMSTPTAHLVIMYGERVQRARTRVLEELEKQAEDLAWAREGALVSVGRPGTHVWSKEEANELVREGRVSGYVATHLHSTSRYPLLAADASNIVFKHESSRKRRKSRRKGRKKSWRQRKKGGV
ncbi:teneurin-m isoform X2 [Procambarus clarkii]|uniref:teneurin-m isoform X2 n=1 Tax=Procambarus clarkii TaxID=6728 RepID=UPI003743B282